MTDSSMEAGLRALGEAVARATERFGAEPPQDRVRAGAWGPPEVLSHLVHWHRLNLESIESVAAGGAPYRVPPDTTIDELNAVALDGMAGTTVAKLMSDLGEIQDRTERRAPALPDPGVTVRIQGDGTERSLERYLNALADYVGRHLAELEGER